MATANDIAKALAHGKSFVGYREKPARSNRTRFGKQYGWDGVAWCVMFVWCILSDTGNDGGVLKTASTGAMERWAKSIGRKVSRPRPGDLIILRNSSGATIHTEFVYSTAGGRLYGLGGNTSGGPGSVADGGTVAINDRTNLWRSGRISFVRPIYGITRDDMKNAQAKLGIKVDGIYGAGTKAAIKAYQAQNGLESDGILGAATLGHLAGEKASKVAQKAAQSASKAKPATKSAQLKVDSRFGSSTVKVLQEFLNKRGAKLAVDGKAGEATWKALQKYLGTPVDGVVSGQSYKASDLGNGITGGWKYTGPGSKGSSMVKALQKWVKVPVDGVWGPATTEGLQRKLNEHNK